MVQFIKPDDQLINFIAINLYISFTFLKCDFTLNSLVNNQILTGYFCIKC